MPKMLSDGEPFALPSPLERFSVTPRQRAAGKDMKCRSPTFTSISGGT